MQAIPKIHWWIAQTFAHLCLANTNPKTHCAIFALKRTFRPNILWKIQLIWAKCGTLSHWAMPIGNSWKQQLSSVSFIAYFIAKAKFGCPIKSAGFMLNQFVSDKMSNTHIAHTQTHTNCGLEFIFVFNEPLSFLNTAAICVIYCWNSNKTWFSLHLLICSTNASRTFQDCGE